MCVNFLQIHQKTDVIVLEQVLEGTIRQSIASAVLNVFYCQTNQNSHQVYFTVDFSDYNFVSTKLNLEICHFLLIVELICVPGDNWLSLYIILFSRF